MSVIGYGRCSTAEQASNGVSLEIQRRAVERAGESNGWDLTWIADDEYPVPPESRKAVQGSACDAGGW